MDDVGLQQLDALLDRHVEEFFRRKVGQLHAGLVDGRQLLLLLHFLGHVADGDDQVPRRTVDFPHRRRMDVEIAALLAPQGGTGAMAGGQGGVKGAEIGAQDFRAAQGGVEVDPDHRLQAAPFADPPVAPENRVVAVQQCDAVGHAFENLLVLQQLADFKGLAEIIGGDVNAGKLVPRQQGHGPHGVLHHHQLVCLGHVG